MSTKIDPNTGDRIISVPGKGDVTETQFRQMVANNEISAGPGGSAAQAAIDSGTYGDPNQSSNQSSNTVKNTNASSSSNQNSNQNPAAAAANNMAAANPGTNFGNLAGTPGADPRTENVYALRNNDDPTSWARRVFAQGTADYGDKSMNPYLSQNPLANSPFTKWAQDRYGLSAPTNSLVAAELSNQAPTATYMQGQMKNAATNPAASGPGDMGSAIGNLRNVQSMLQNYAGGASGLSPTQNLFAGQLMQDPQLASQIITGQLQGATGGWGMGYLSNMLSNLATQYYNDPANQGPQAKGSFMGQALKMMGAG